MKKTEKEQAAWLIAVSGANPGACMRCGRCTAACPVAGEMDIKPHHFASFLLHGQAGALLQSQSIWVCLFLQKEMNFQSEMRIQKYVRNLSL